MAEVRKELVDAIAVKDKDFDNKRSRLVPTNSVTLLGKTYKLRDIINEYA